MERKRLVTHRSLCEEEERFHWSLRPQSFDEWIGQRDTVDKLSISIQAARKRGEPLEHTLFYGPPGLGKTTLAHIIAKEMGTRLVAISGPGLERTGDLMGVLTNLERGDVLFIDEVHRLPTAVEEFLYPAMEDFHIDFIVDKGAFARTVPVRLKEFTLVGATTRAGLISSPLRERFGIFHHVDFYPVEDLRQVIRRSGRLLGTPLDEDAEMELAKRSRGTPRIANRLLRRVRDYAEVRWDGRITHRIAEEALELEGIDHRGLDGLDRKLLTTIIDYYHGGPVGIGALAATLSEEEDVLVDMVEPYLLKIGFVNRTRSGRKATPLAYQHLGLTAPAEGQGGDLQESFWGG